MQTQTRETPTTDEPNGNVIAHPSSPIPVCTTYVQIADHMLAAAIYNRRHVSEDQRLVTWDEIAANEVTRNFYLAAAAQAMRAIWPNGGY